MPFNLSGVAMSDDYGEKLHAAMGAELVRATTRPDGSFDVRPEAVAAVMLAIAIAALRADRDLPAALYWLRERIAEVIADELSATPGKDMPPPLPEGEGSRAQAHADEMTRIVVTYAALLQAHPCHFMDAAWLPADKHKMIEIFKKLWLGGDEERRNKVENWWCLLARFQAGVGAIPITYEIPNDITVKEWRERVEQVERWGELVTAEDKSYEREIKRFKADGLDTAAASAAPAAWRCWRRCAGPYSAKVKRKPRAPTRALGARSETAGQELTASGAVSLPNIRARAGDNSITSGMYVRYPVRPYFFVYGDKALRVATFLLRLPKSHCAFLKASHV